MAGVLSVVLFEDAGDMVRLGVQLAVLWIPLVVLWYAPALVRAWRQVLLGLASLTAALFVVYLAGPLILGALVGPLYDLDVDHRPRAFPGVANEDGVKPDRPASSYTSEQFNIVFLGDSFTAGEGLSEGEEPFPAHLERLLVGRSPEVRVANFGYLSSSPVLQERQLKQLGERYAPDLVLQAFDMSDFKDDLHYTELLGDRRTPRDANIFRVMELRFSLALGVADFRHWWWEQLRFVDETPVKGWMYTEKDRFFAMKQPLESSRPLLATTWAAILGAHEEAERLGAGYALFVLPRYQHFNAAECPEDWETPWFEGTEGYLDEPFRYFEEQGEAAAFPVHSLLDAFRESGVFPVVLPDDPHYNATGHRVAAEALVGLLEGDGLLE